MLTLRHASRSAPERMLVGHRSRARVIAPTEKARKSHQRRYSTPRGYRAQESRLPRAAPRWALAPDCRATHRAHLWTGKSAVQTNIRLIPRDNGPRPDTNQASAMKIPECGWPLRQLERRSGAAHRLEHSSQSRCLALSRVAVEGVSAPFPIPGPPLQHVVRDHEDCVRYCTQGHLRASHFASLPYCADM
jgi:hypothetical protein